MHYVYLSAAIIIAVMLSVIIGEYFKSHCSSCGTKMDRYYDPEEDCKVYQCPKCGRSYLIR